MTALNDLCLKLGTLTNGVFKMTDKQYAEKIQAVIDKLFPNTGSNATLYEELQKAVWDTEFETDRQLKIHQLFDKLEGALVDFEDEVKSAIKSN